MGEICSYNTRVCSCYYYPTNSSSLKKAEGNKNQKPEASTSQSNASFWDSLSFWPKGLKFGGTVGCAEESSPVVERLHDGGIGMYPPQISDAGPDGGEKTESGATIFGPAGTKNPQEWGVVILPVDEKGEVILPDDIWYIVEGNGGFFQETPWILLESGDIMGQGLQNLNLVVEIGTDSTKIEEGMGCFDGLINVSKLSEEEVQEGLGCPEEGYNNFAVCPSDPNNRLTLYLAGYKMEGYQWVNKDECIENGQIKDDCFKITVNGSDMYFKKIGEVGNTSVTNVEDLYANPEGAEKVGVVCGSNPNPKVIDIPKEYYADGRLYLKLKLQKIVDARPADKNAHYETRLRVRIKAKKEE